MSRRADISSILIIGTGPIVFGQPAELEARTAHAKEGAR
jgi:hypothetical protein